MYVSRVELCNVAGLSMPRIDTKVELKAEGRIGGSVSWKNVRVTSESEWNCALYTTSDRVPG